ncbi:MAG: tRNA uridine-5-carboxymethylaminomethyl(34) synthesis enzyme MnmG [Chlamydiota bacterium]
MWTYPKKYDVIIIGGGHAGCEAAFITAGMGASTLLLSMNLDTLAKMSCNPAIGGIAKGHIVREIDALGGIMAKVIDRTSIQFRMLNVSRGAAVWAPRAQADKLAYQSTMKHLLEQTPNLDIKEATVEELVAEEGKILGAKTIDGIFYSGETVILCSGTFMKGLLHIGSASYSGGRAGDKPCLTISDSLKRLGFQMERLKTGTPPRLNINSIDLNKVEEQHGQEGGKFSYDDEDYTPLPQVSCYITYTTPETQQIIKDNIHLSPLYSGRITGVGPRYCPSIEDKVMRFPHKDRHQIFLEPEGLQTNEIYANGISSSLPIEVQMDFIHSITGLEKAEMMRPAYAIEYDYVESGQIKYSLETKLVDGLFLAGQINGTSGYEEAAAQGLMAGINAVSKIREEEPLILKRSEAYIGVMIDDLVTKGIDEPYRMFTSRAEHRLLLRQDNADLRLREYGYQRGLIDEERYQKLCHKKITIAEELERFKKVYITVKGRGMSLAQLLCRPENSYLDLLEAYPNKVTDHGEDINLQIELNLKYEGYIQRQIQDVAKLNNLEKVIIPSDFDYSAIKGLRNEAQEKLLAVRPSNLGQASRISGINPADISILRVALK